MPAHVLSSYNLKGLKENFANWIGEITPSDAFFVSHANVDNTNNTRVQWVYDQNEYFGVAEAPDHGEGSEAADFNAQEDLVVNKDGQTVDFNYTQIFRKKVRISETALNTSVYGRSDELAYQLAKAGIALKTRMEAHMLGAFAKAAESDTVRAKTASVVNLLSADPHPQTTKPAVTKAALSADAIVTKCTDLFLNGSHAHVMLFNPEDAEFVHGAIAKPIKADVPRPRLQLFKEEEIPATGESFSKEKLTFTSNEGRLFICKASRYVPKGTVLFVDPMDWDLVYLREPKVAKLDSDGSYQTYLIECEVALRNRHPWCGGAIVPTA